jgi:hypothetical protein
MKIVLKDSPSPLLKTDATVLFASFFVTCYSLDLAVTALILRQDARQLRMALR